MAINITNTKGSVDNIGFRALIIAESGMGKTSIFKSTGKTIVISSEGSELTLNDSDVDMINISSVSELREAYEYVSDNTDKYDTVGIDSVTDIFELIVEELEKDPYYGDIKNSMPKWMEYTKRATAIAKSFRDLQGINVILLALPESVKNGFDEKIMPLIPAKKAQAKLGSLYDLVLRIVTDEDGNRNFICQPTNDFAAKDRSDKLDPIEPYTKELGIKPLIDKIKG